MNVAVIGASKKTHRYSYQAIFALIEQDHDVFPVHPKLEEIEGIKVYNSISDIPEKIDTITMYVGAKASGMMEDEIISKRPKRIIFNPGAENSQLENKANKANIATINACTLVMLKTGQF